jgi:hypothetical protein
MLADSAPRGQGEKKAGGARRSCSPGGRSGPRAPPHARARTGAKSPPRDPSPAIDARARFGRLAAELRIEAEAFAADLSGLAAPARPGLRHQVRAWYLGRTLPAPVVLLPVAAGDTAGGRRESVILPAFRRTRGSSAPSPKPATIARRPSTIR